MEENKFELAPQSALLAAPDTSFEEGEVVTHPALAFIGRKCRIETQKGKDGLQQVKAFWDACEEDGTLAALRALSPAANCFVSACNNFESHAYDFWIMVQVTEDLPVPDGFDTLQTPEGMHARFRSVGPAQESVHKRWAAIYKDWFPKASYSHTYAPELEIYPFGDMAAEDYCVELRVPVKERPPMRKPRIPLAMMLYPLIGCVLGMLLGSGSGNGTSAMLAGLALGFVVAAVQTQLRENREKRAREAEKNEEKKD